MWNGFLSKGSRKRFTFDLISFIRPSCLLAIALFIAVSPLCGYASDDDQFEMIETRRYERSEEQSEGPEKENRSFTNVAEITTTWIPQPSEMKEAKRFSVTCTRFVISVERGELKTRWDSNDKSEVPERFGRFANILGDTQIVQVGDFGELSILQLGPVASEVAKYRSEVMQQRRDFSKKQRLGPEDIAAFDKKAEDEIKKAIEWMMLPPSVSKVNGEGRFEIRNCDFPMDFRDGYSIRFKSKPHQPNDEQLVVDVELSPNLKSDPFYCRAVQKSDGKVKFVLSSEKHFPAPGSFVANYELVDSTKGSLLVNKINLVADVQWVIKEKNENDK